MNYQEFLPRLKELDINANGYKQILDTEKIEALTNNILLGIDLPINITSKLGSIELLEDQDVYKEMQTLPKNILLKTIEVIDSDEIDKIITYRELNHDLNPDGIISRNTTINGEIKLVFLYQEVYYKQLYNFFETFILSDEEMKFKLMTANLESLKTIKDTVESTKRVLVIILIIITFYISIFLIP